MLSALLLSLLLVPAPAAPRPTAVQDEPPPADERPEVKAKLDELEQLVKAKGEKDPEAIGVIDALVQEFPASGPKDRVAIAKALGDCFDVKRPKELEEGVPDDRLYVAAATALGTMGPESVKVLLPLIGDKAHRKNLRLQQTIVHSVGKTKSPDAVKTLLGLLKHKDAPMQAAGAEAMANYADAPDETRKELFEACLNTMMDQFSRKETNPTDQESQDRWNTISGPLIATLQRLSGHGETAPQAWLQWWNDNKKRAWDAG